MIRPALIVAALVLIVTATPSHADTRYFDVNDNVAGSGLQSDETRTWDTSNTYWNPNSDGGGAIPETTLPWANGDKAVFSAGADSTGVRYLLDILAGTTAEGATIEEGTVVINSGTLDTDIGTAEVLAGATVEVKMSNQFNGSGTLKLSGGRLVSSGSGGTTLVSSTKAIEINGSGTIEYSNGDALFDNGVSNISNVITGTGGTPANGGTGTLIKQGMDQVVYGGRDTGGAVFNWQLNSFAKLKVQQGGFRIKNVSSQIDERLFGAVPVVPLADAITLDGGGIGTNQTVTLNINRGITIGPNGGYFDPAAMGGINIPGTLTALPGATLRIGNPYASTPFNPVFELSNPNNATTFQGNLVVSRGILQLDSSLNAANFSGTASSGSNFGIVRIAPEAILTMGSDGADTTYEGSIADITPVPGTGGVITKIGAGTLTLNTANSASWSNTGGVNINAGTIKYSSATAGFGNATPVAIGATGKLNMNGFSDIFGSLSGPAGAIVDTKDTAASPGALALTATIGTQSYGGTIIGGGNLTKTGAATQALAGISTLGTVAVNGGTLLANATMTTSGGVAIASGATLGGIGTVVGVVTNNGTIAPGSSGVGNLSVTGNFTDSANSNWEIELSGATADKLSVTGDIDLSAVDSLNVSGTGSGSSWLIGTYTGSLTGVFDTITAGYSVTYSGGQIVLNAPVVGLPGDFNSDGKVDAGDYVTWKKNDGTNNALANDNGLGTPIGTAHYDLWRANFGNPPGSGSGGDLSATSVPEPTSLSLLIVALLTVGRGRHNRVA